MKRIITLVAILFSFDVASSEDLSKILDGKESSSSKDFVQRETLLTQSLRSQMGVSASERTIFLGLLDENRYKDALYRWVSTLSGTPFAKTATGKALYSYLLIKNDLPVNGVEELFSISKPQNINRYLKRILKEELPLKNPAWAQAKIEWKPAWTEVFSLDVAVDVQSRKKLNLKKTKNIERLWRTAKVGSEARHRLQWQLILSYALRGKAKSAVEKLSHLLKSDQGVVDPSLLIVTAARLLYREGYLQDAIKYYSQVPKKSPYWFVAQEEKAWAYLRKGEPQNALAVGKTVMKKEFIPHVGPEMVFLLSVAQLKVCDYPQVAKSVRAFKDRYQARAKALLEVRDSRETAAPEKLIGLLENEKRKTTSLGKAVFKLPRFISKDQVLYGHVQRSKALAREAKVAGTLYSQSLSGSTGGVGFQPRFEKLKKRFEMRARTARTAGRSIVVERAKAELTEIQKALQKMHVVEVELIQQVGMAQRLVAETKVKKAKNVSIKKGHRAKKEKYTLEFPFTGEEWFDELDSFSVDVVKGCQSTKKSG